MPTPTKAESIWHHFDFLMVLGTKPAAFNMLGKNSAIKLHHQACVSALIINRETGNYHTAHQFCKHGDRL